MNEPRINLAMHERERVFALDHRAAAGHFPGNPMIPGAVLLDFALRSIVPDYPTAVGSLLLTRTKFLRPVRPGDAILVRWRQLPGSIEFQCRLKATDEITMMGAIATVEVQAISE